jgi:hypothetical protein
MAITIFTPPNVLQAGSTLRLAARELPGQLAEGYGRSLTSAYSDRG